MTAGGRGGVRENAARGVDLLAGSKSGVKHFDHRARGQVASVREVEACIRTRTKRSVHGQHPVALQTRGPNEGRVDVQQPRTRGDGECVLVADGRLVPVALRVHPAFGEHDGVRACRVGKRVDTSVRGHRSQRDATLHLGTPVEPLFHDLRPVTDQRHRASKKGESIDLCLAQLLGRCELRRSKNNAGHVRCSRQSQVCLVFGVGHHRGVAAPNARAERCSVPRGGDLPVVKPRNEGGFGGRGDAEVLCCLGDVEKEVGALVGVRRERHRNKVP